MLPKVVWRKKLRAFDTSNIMTFCQIFKVASRVRQKVVYHRSLTIEKCSGQEKSRWRQKVVDGRVVDDRIYCIYRHSRTTVNTSLDVGYKPSGFGDKFRTFSVGIFNLLIMWMKTWSWIWFSVGLVVTLNVWIFMRAPWQMSESSMGHPL